MTGPTNSSKTATPPSTKAVGWKTVSVFVSSTFDDMHAERDYLVKEVFPRLREWCEQRRLRVVDVDLRWGVTEADATNNKRVVDVCLPHRRSVTAPVSRTVMTGNPRTSAMRFWSFVVGDDTIRSVKARW
jgi:hypothetical protein